MENRVLFRKGKQKEFLDFVKDRLRVNSLRGILQFGFDVKYSTLKDYYNERLLMPVSFFESLVYMAKMKKVNGIKYVRGNWGQVKGGKKSKRS